MENLGALKKDFLSKIQQVNSLDDLENLRVFYLGRKGKITQLLHSIGSLPVAERPQFGKEINKLKFFIETELEKKKNKWEKGDKESCARDISEPFLPLALNEKGSIHPISQVIEEVKEILYGMGFVLADGPEVEWDYFNFEALNMFKDHPSRDTQDSFFFTDKMLLRTQTSSVQIRVMKKQAPPVRMFSIGRCYRRDYDLTHIPVFHQFEGLVIDKGINITHLKGILARAMRELFGKNVKVRFRPHHFPFTEPSLEPDVSCTICEGKGCRTCKHTGWLEMGGCGMVHPQVLRNGGYDPNEVTGFAFGFGIERPVMLKYGISDIRLLYQNDLRLLRQF